MSEMTHAQLFDLLHELFGFGDYDEILTPDRQWWKVRNTEIAKLRATMRKSRATIEQVEVAARYAAASRCGIRYYSEITRLIPDALRHRNLARRLEASANARSLVEDAAAEAFAAGDYDWAERILRADRAEVQHVIASWKETRHG